MKKYGEYYVTIGLEVHVALQTTTKLFSRSENDFEAPAFSLFDAGLPGMMPVLAKKPVEMALAFAKSVQATIPEVSYFERKHYFYPDLPLGYQITQQHHPIMIGGTVPISIDGQHIDVIIEHAHLECDAAKSLHDMYRQYTAIDLTRCASPLLEIVSTPCMHSPEEAKAYAMAVCDLVKFLGICDGKLEEGSFRVDASISLSKTEQLGTRVEIKNISSFGFLQTALEYEIERQTIVLSSGKPVQMETRLFDETTSSTQSMRKKETVMEYRYMPDPDIAPLVITQEMLSEVDSHYMSDYFDKRAQLKTLIQHFSLDVEEVWCSRLFLEPYRSATLALLQDTSLQSEYMLRALCFWSTEILSKSETTKQLTSVEMYAIAQSGLQAKEYKTALQQWLISSQSLKDCFPSFMSDLQLQTLVRDVLKSYPDQLQMYYSGQEKIVKFLVGKVMAQVKGEAPASTVKQQVDTQLSKGITFFE